MTEDKQLETVEKVGTYLMLGTFMVCVLSLIGIVIWGVFIA